MTLPLFARSNRACSAAICVASIMMVLALSAVFWSLPKAKPASAVSAAAARVQETTTKEAARKNFNIKHTLKRRHHQTKRYLFIIVRLLLHPTRVFARSPHLCPVRQPSLLVHRAFMMRRSKVNSTQLKVRPTVQRIRHPVPKPINLDHWYVAFANNLSRTNHSVL